MKRFSLFFVLLIFVVTIAFLPAFAQTPTPTPTPKTVYIRAGHLFDGTGDKLRDNMVIVVVGDRIQSVSPGIQSQSLRARLSSTFPTPPCFPG